MKPNEINKAIDILDKFDFFYGQRAGRELWNDKPVDVQNQDIEDFARDIKYLKAYINQLEAEVERLTRLNFQAEALNEAYEESISEAIKEFAEKIKSKIYIAHFGSIKRGFNVTTINPSDIDNLVKEMVGDEK